MLRNEPIAVAVVSSKKSIMSDDDNGEGEQTTGEQTTGNPLFMTVGVFNSTGQLA
jgi:hypothetical protein